MPQDELDYVNVHLCQRAPRVAVVFDASTTLWTLFAQFAIRGANRIWGGGGFILIPHRDGLVSAEMLRTAIAYDPDYVVCAPVTYEDMEAAEPGWIRRKINTEDIPSDQVATFLEAAKNDRVVSAADRAARETVARACSPHQRLVEDSTATAARNGDSRGRALWDEQLEDLAPSRGNSPLPSSPLTSVESFGTPASLCLAAPEDLGGVWGVAVAAKAGMIDRPRQQAWSPSPAEQDELAAWILDRGSAVRSLPRQLVYQPNEIQLSVEPGAQPIAWSLTTTGLVPLTEGTSRPAVHIVVGDTADDFALALALDRIWGAGLWIHSDWDPTNDETTAESVRRGLRWITRQGIRGESVVVTSATRNDNDLEPHRAFLRAALPHLVYPGPAEGDVGLEFRSGPDWDGGGKRLLGVIDTFDINVPVPVRRASDGTVTYAAPLVGVVPEIAELANNGQLTWQVDVISNDALMPMAHGLDGHRLIAEGTDDYETWVRPSRVGVTFHSIRYSWVGANETPAQRLARPRLRVLGLESWVRALARQHEYDTSYSDAGMRTHILARLWGGRNELAADFAGPLWGALAKWTRPGKSTKEAYPAGDGNLITGFGGVLTFDGVRSAWDVPVTEEDVRDELDTLLERGIVRRGLVIACLACSRLVFASVDDLRQINTCDRCGAANDLRRQAWSSTPAAEPTWYYDLHGVARTLIDENGHAPLWLSHYLRATSKSYASVAETLLLKPGTRASQAETDLIALCDRRLITAEVKTSNTLGTTKAQRESSARKRIKWAEVLRADEILLATAAPQWEAASVSAVTAAVREHSWAAGHVPRVRLITGLGTPKPESQYR